jgi:hypothetical protein
MANGRGANVYYVDTDNTTIAGPIHITAIKYVGASSGTANIKADSDSGTILWSEASDTNTFNQVNIRTNTSLYVNLANNAVIIIYTATK